jgi:signal transduction histidine kinase
MRAWRFNTQSYLDQAQRQSRCAARQGGGRCMGPRTSTLDGLGLAGAIAETARDLDLRATIDAQPPETLQADVEVAALRIAQEALHNIARPPVRPPATRR